MTRTEKPCRWVADGQPRMLRTHVRDCNASGCAGCQPCAERHCALCGREHVTVEGRGEDQVCASCIGVVREDLEHIEVRCRQLLSEALHRGVNSEAANLAGPAPDTAETIEAHRHRQMSAFWGRIPELGEDDLHPLWVLGTWELLVREHLTQPAHERITVPRARRYLGAHLTRLAHDPEFPFDELAKDTGRCRTHLEAVLHDSRIPEQGAPCPLCGKAKLVKAYAKKVADDRWRCPRCPAEYTEKDYRSKVEASYLDVADRLTASQITRTYRVPESTVRKWAQRGKVRKHGTDAQGRMLYDVSDVVQQRDLQEPA